jgi:hypothetical protein
MCLLELRLMITPPSNINDLLSIYNNYLLEPNVILTFSFTIIKMRAMKKLISFLSVLFLMLPLLGQANNDSLLQRYLEKKSPDVYTMSVKEIKRGADTSEIITSYGSNHRHVSPLESSTFIMCTAYQIAKERGFKTMVKLQEQVPGDILMGWSNQSIPELIRHFAYINNQLKEDDIFPIDTFSIICDRPSSAITIEYYQPTTNR